MEGGIMPLDYLLSVMRDANNDQAARVDAAKAAAPYLHPKLAVQEVEHTPAGPVTYIWEGIEAKRRRRHERGDQAGISASPAVRC
jgi:hypothetical protein